MPPGSYNTMVIRLNTSRSPIGLDIGSRFIKAAQLSAGRDDAGCPRLEAALILERDTPGQPFTNGEAHRLRAILERRGFKGRQIAATVPGDALMTSILNLPPRDSEAPLDAIAAAELARTHRQEADALEVAFWDLPQSDNPISAATRKPGTTVMAVGCRHEHANALLDALESPGFDVLALDLEGWALSRAIAPLLDSQHPLTALIDIGWRGVNFVLLYEQAVVYERMLGGTGIQALTDLIHREQPFSQAVIDYLLANVGFNTDRENIPSEDSRLADTLRSPLDQHFEGLTQELQLSLGYAAHQYPHASLGSLLLCGGGAMVHSLDAYLASQLEIPTRVVTPTTICALPARGLALDESEQAALTTAIGMALYPRKEAI